MMGPEHQSQQTEMPGRERLNWKGYVLPLEALSSVMDQMKKDSWEPTQLSWAHRSHALLGQQTEF